jgi:NADPH-dependent 2,4-dienoyl-CoA reductase/sulfur reductase-like enzyme
MQSSVPGLYAAGDVAQGVNLLTGRRELIGLWASACSQGRCAGRNLADRPDEYPGGVPSNVVHFFDSLFVAIGDARTAAAGIEVVDPDARTYCRLAEESGRLVGVNLLDCCRPAGMLRQAIVRGLGQTASARLDWAEFCRRLFAVEDEGSILWSLLGKEFDT